MSLSQHTQDLDSIPPVVVVLFSGGIDSTVALYDELNTMRDLDFLGKPRYLVAAFLHYGQHAFPHEFASAQRILDQAQTRAEDLKTVRIIRQRIDLDSVRPRMGTNQLFQLPQNRDQDSFIPGRNQLLVTAAACRVASEFPATRIAISLGIYNGGDKAVYNHPDCTHEFLSALNYLLGLSFNGRVGAYSRYINMDKPEIIQRGHVLQAPLHDTVSCYFPMPGPKTSPDMTELPFVHCGVCAACKERRKSFEKAGVSDPTQYRE